MATTSNDLTTLDFETVKDNLKTYLKGQDLFKDYDFDASNISVLLDILAYNTNLNGFYLNMIANEMFLDSALLRDSIISHAKELNYLPRSFRSAQATINITLTDSSDNSTVLIPRGTTFTGRSNNKNFTFTTAENVQAGSTDVTNQFVANNVTIYEGDYVQDSYVTDNTSQPRFLITNKTVDTNSLKVIVIEDNGAVTLTYEKRDSLFGIGSQDKVFFLQAAENDTYEILFGDGVIGRQPKNNSIVLIEYRACNGELPNGLQVFTADDDVGSAVVSTVTTVTKASGGSIPETLESIKFNAPRAFTTQERVVTAQDYATLLKANFSEINDVAAFGGEEFDPPQFGKVIVSVDLKNTDLLPDSYREKYRQFIAPRSPLSIDPVFVKPDYLYLSIDTTVKYDISQTSLGVDDIKSLVVSSIQAFNENNLNGFNKTMRYSKMIAAIDNSQDSVISNDTIVKATQYLPLVQGERSSYKLDFAMALNDTFGHRIKEQKVNESTTVMTDKFQFNGLTAHISDDGKGKLVVVCEPDQDEGDAIVLAEVGSIDYNSGVLILDDFATGDQKTQLKFTVVPKERDIPSIKTSILRVLDEDIVVQVEQVRLSG